MNRVRGALFCLWLLLVSGCSGVQVSQDYELGLEFSSLQTYGWKTVRMEQGEDIRVNNPLLHKRFHQEINRVMMKKGYVRNEHPDFLIQYSYSISTRLQSDPVGTGFGFGVGPYRHYGAFAIYSGTEIRQYDVGMLVIDFYDAQSGELVWRGNGSQIIERHPTPEQTTQMVKQLVEAILTQFPPGQVK